MLFDIQILIDSKVCNVFQTIILDEIKKNHQGFYTTNIDDIEVLWSGIKNVIQKAVEKTVGVQRRIKRPWFNKICEEGTKTG